MLPCNVQQLNTADQREFDAEQNPEAICLLSSHGDTKEVSQGVVTCPGFLDRLNIRD